jgi:hypothetical protein
MFRPLAILAAACLCASPVWGAAIQTPPDMAEREAAAHRLLDPMVDEISEELLAPLWDDLASIEVEADERVALRKAFDQELVLVGQDFKDRLAVVVARNVPLDEITPEMDSPGWGVAERELDALVSEWAVARGIEMGARVIEAGCGARPKPSAGCDAALRHVARYRSGDLTVEEIMAD